MLSFDVVAIAATTVFKIGFAVACGVLVSPYLEDPTRSEKGLSFIAVRILLPCMLFGNLCLDVSVDLLSRYYWAVVMSLLPMLLGALASLLFFPLVRPEYRVLIVLGSTFQNGLLFPLSVVTSIRGIAWLDEKAVNACQQYVFLYNLCCALGLWSIGGPMVKHCKEKLVQEQEDAAEELYYERRRRHNLKCFLAELKSRPRRHEELGDAATRRDAEAVQEAAFSPRAAPFAGEARPGGGEERAGAVTSAGASAAEPRDAGGETGKGDEVLLGADARPTVQGQLLWYRPARRNARPIDVSKFDRWRAASQGREDRPHSQEPRLTADRGDGVRACGGPVAFPAAPEEAMYSERAHNHLDETRREAEGRRCQDADERADNAAAATATATPVIRYSDFHTLAVSPPGTPRLEDGRADGDGISVVPSRDNPLAHRCHWCKECLLFGVCTPPVYITAVAIAVSTVPPLRWCAQTYFGLSAIKGIALVGAACVPCQLIALGCTLAKKKEEEAAAAVPFAFQQGLEGNDKSPDEVCAAERVNEDLRPHTDRRRQTAQRKRPRAACDTADAEAEPTSARRVCADSLLTAQPVFDVNGTTDGAVRRAANENSSGNGEGGAEEEEEGEGGGRGFASGRSTSQPPQSTPLRQRREVLASMDNAVRRVWHRIPDATRFTCIVVFLRLLLLPAVAFWVVHWLIRLGAMPLDRSFVISILIGVSSPAAVNASLVCTLHDYHAGEFSRMIFTMYCLAAITSTLWLALSISYTSAFVPQKQPPPYPEDW